MDLDQLFVGLCEFLVVGWEGECSITLIFPSLDGDDVAVLSLDIADLLMHCPFPSLPLPSLPFSSLYYLFQLIFNCSFHLVPSSFPFSYHSTIASLCSLIPQLADLFPPHLVFVFGFIGLGVLNLIISVSRWRNGLEVFSVGLNYAESC